MRQIVDSERPILSDAIGINPCQNGRQKPFIQMVRGGTSRKGNLCILRRAGGVSRASERSEAAFGYPLIGVPGVIASEIDVFPAKRRDVLEQGGIALP
jgi:hypothetical protein